MSWHLSAFWSNKKIKKKTGFWVSAQDGRACRTSLPARTWMNMVRAFSRSLQHHIPRERGLHAPNIPLNRHEQAHRRAARASHLPFPRESRQARTTLHPPVSACSSFCP